jgi:hypothetical protein
MFNFAQIRSEKKAVSVGGLFHFNLMSLVGTNAKCRLLRAMSEFEGKAEDKCSC